MRQKYNFLDYTFKETNQTHTHAHAHTHARDSEQINTSVTETLSRDSGPCQQQSLSNKTPEKPTSAFIHLLH